MHQHGQGVPKDRIKAYAWYNLAAAEDDESSAKARDEIERHMTSDQIALAQLLTSKLLNPNKPEAKPSNPNSPKGEWNGLLLLRKATCLPTTMSLKVLRGLKLFSVRDESYQQS